MIVSCLSDGVQVEIHIEEKGFNGVLYVKGHSKDEKCRRVLSVPNDSPIRTEIFKVNFGTCGLIHVNVNILFIINSFKIMIEINSLIKIVSFPGTGKFCSSHSKAPHAGNIQNSSVSHQMCLYNWRTKCDSWLQCFYVDNSWNHCKHWATTHLLYAYRYPLWSGDQLSRNRR